MIPQLVVNILLQFSLISIVGISFFFIFNSGKYYALHHASIISFGGYFTWLIVNTGLTLFLSIIASIFITAVLGVIIELFLINRLRKRNPYSFQLIIASLGLYIILKSLISIIFGTDSKIIRAGDISAGTEIMGAYITNNQFLIIGINVAIVLFTLLFLNRTRIGRIIEAVSENQDLSEIFGISKNKTIIWSFAIGSAIAAISGVLIGIESKITPFMGFNILFYGVIAMIIGGMGNLKGLILASFLIALSQHLGAYYFDSKWMDAIAYIILILFLIWKPLGFSGKQLKKVEI
jgi:branched-subunit amino acid ABC-type transport system permease component